MAQCCRIIQPSFNKCLGIHKVCLGFNRIHRNVDKNYFKKSKNSCICITFLQRRPNVFDVGPTLYKCYTNVLCLLGRAVFIFFVYLSNKQIKLKMSTKFATLANVFIKIVHDLSIFFTLEVVGRCGDRQL